MFVPFPLPNPSIDPLPSMELSGGEQVTAKRACSATGEDRISALPDETLLVILLLLSSAADAARTSVLSRRWRTVLPQLPELRVPFLPEPLSFRRALVGASHLPLSYLGLEGDGTTPASVGILLRAAARRLTGSLILINRAPDPEPDFWMPPPPPRRKGRKKKKSKRDRIQMPCFEHTDRIFLNLGFLRVTIPSAGVFARLTLLVVHRAQFIGGSCDQLGDAVSWPRCPHLRGLKLSRVRGLHRLAISSGSLLVLELVRVRDLQELTVDAAALQELAVDSCFPSQWHGQLVATISAPRLIVLKWDDMYGQRCLELGPVPHLRYIGGLVYVVYADQQGSHGANSACLKLMRRFKAVERLSLVLAYVAGELSNYEYAMEDMKILPDHKVLNLNVLASGHSFGASSYHVLMMCVGIRMLVLRLYENMIEKALLANFGLEVQTSCPAGCVCDQQSTWKHQELSLIKLQEIFIEQLRGSEHEVSFVKCLIHWATALNKMTIYLDPSTTESKARELFQMFESLSRPGVCMEFYLNRKKVSYAP